MHAVRHAVQHAAHTARPVGIHAAGRAARCMPRFQRCMPRFQRCMPRFQQCMARFQRPTIATSNPTDPTGAQQGRIQSCASCVIVGIPVPCRARCHERINAPLSPLPALSGSASQVTPSVSTQSSVCLSVCLSACSAPQDPPVHKVCVSVCLSVCPALQDPPVGHVLEVCLSVCPQDPPVVEEVDHGHVHGRQDDGVLLGMLLYQFLGGLRATRG
jgi:hypothetical protein